MSKLSFADKIGVLVEISKSSYLFIGLIIVLVGLGILFLTTNKKTAQRNKMIYIACSIFIIVFLILFFHVSLGNMFDYMMNNFFIVLFFPNLAIYLAAIFIMNIIVWISIFNFKTSEIIKKVNIIVFVLMNYLQALLLNIITSENLDVFQQSSVYKNEKASALIELSSTLFIVWIIFLILYKIILVYIRKDYKPKVKKVIIKRKVKKLPDNYEPIIMPYQIKGNIKTSNCLEKPKKSLQATLDSNLTMNTKEQLLKEQYEKMLTLEDYKLLLSMLKVERQKHDNHQRKIEEERLEEQHKIEEQRIAEQKKLEEQRRIEEQRIAEQKRLEEQRRIEEQQRIEQKRLEREVQMQKQRELVKQEEAEREQRKFTELELLYGSIR